MFLVVTPIEEFWDKDDELLFIGSWCALHDRRDRWSGLRHRFLPDPWRDARRYDAGVEHCREVSARIFQELSAYLNRTHGTDYDARYWRLLIDPWLSFHVEQMYDHYTLVDEAFRVDPDLRTVLLDPAEFETPRDMSDFLRMIFGDRYHLQLFSHILSARKPGLPTRRSAPPDADDPAARRLASSVADPAMRRGFKASLKRVMSSALRVLVALGAGRVFLADLGLRRNQLVGLVLRSGLKALPFYAALPDSTRLPPVMDGRRRGLAGMAARDEFEKVIVSSLPAHLPTIFLEGYMEARRITKEGLPRVPDAFFSSVGWHYPDPFKFAAAECYSRGSRLWGMQHGASYGLAATSWAERFERDVCDRYFSWGWAKLDGDPRLRDLPAPMLSQTEPSSAGKDLLFVSTSLDLHNIRLIRDTNGAGALAAIERQARFLRALPEPASANALVRLFRHDWGWCHRERLLEMFPAARFDDSHVPFARRMREARLVIVDIPSTPMYETLAADVPCLMTWAADTWPCRPSARPFIDAFRKAGMLFDSPEEAAAEAARVYEDPRKWWDEPVRREARLSFLKTFALSDPDWTSAWVKEIRSGLET